MRKFIFFLLFLFLISLTSSEQIVVSPGELSFQISQGQVSCKNITVSTFGEVVISDRWNEKWLSTKNLQDYKILHKELNLDLDYSNSISVENKTKLIVCFSGKDVGKYHGVLLIRNKDSKSGIGIWINSTIEKGNYYSSKITGASIIEDKVETNLISLFVTLSTLLLLIFLILFCKNRKKFIHPFEFPHKHNSQQLLHQNKQ